MRRRQSKRGTDAVLGGGGLGQWQQLAVWGARDADLPRGTLLLSLGVVRLLPNLYLIPTPTPTLPSTSPNPNPNPSYAYPYPW